MESLNEMIKKSKWIVLRRDWDCIIIPNEAIKNIDCKEVKRISYKKMDKLEPYSDSAVLTPPYKYFEPCQVKIGEHFAELTDEARQMYINSVANMQDDAKKRREDVKSLKAGLVELENASLEELKKIQKTNPNVKIGDSINVLLNNVGIVKEINSEEDKLGVEVSGNVMTIDMPRDILPRHIYLLKKHKGNIAETIEELKAEIKECNRIIKLANYKVPSYVKAGEVDYKTTLHIEIDLKWAKENHILGLFNYREESVYDEIRNGMDMWYFLLYSTESLEELLENCIGDTTGLLATCPVVYDSFNRDDLNKHNSFEIITENKDSLIIDIHPKNRRVYQRDGKESILTEGIEYVIG
ncbi:MAG: hypothetical protein LBL91_02465 [Lachnospiraceae bacterium]|nr:hypothetical protein [Lachnospiraceae bacterium]